MSFVVQLFAAIRDAAGAETIAVDVTGNVTAATVRQAIAESLPAVAPLVAVSRLAVDQQFASDDTVVEVGSELALIPPVSGG